MEMHKKYVDAICAAAQLGHVVDVLQHNGGMLCQSVIPTILSLEGQFAAARVCGIMASRGRSQPELVEADANEWNRLVVLSTISDDLHVVKAVCLDTTPSSSPRTTFFCLTPHGQPVTTGVFLMEDGLEAVLTPYNDSDRTHKVMDVVFSTEDVDSDVDGVVVALRDPHEAITHDNLSRLRNQ